MSTMEMVMPFFGGKRRVIREFFSDATWVAPFTTSRLEVLNGVGQDGSAGGATTTSRPVGNVTWLPGSGGGTVGVLDWSTPQAAASAARDAINAGGNVSWFERQYTQYSNGTYSQFVNGGSFSNVVAGTAVLNVTSGWQSSGPVTGGGSAQGWDATVTFTYTTLGSTNGLNTTAFGFTFAGGVAGPAVPVQKTAVTVTPGASYGIVVPPGGYVSILYYE